MAPVGLKIRCPFGGVGVRVPPRALHDGNLIQDQIVGLDFEVLHGRPAHVDVCAKVVELAEFVLRWDVSRRSHLGCGEAAEGPGPAFQLGPESATRTRTAGPCT